MTDVLEEGGVVGIVLAFVVRSNARDLKVDEFQGIEERDRAAGGFGEGDDEG